MVLLETFAGRSMVIVLTIYPRLSRRVGDFFVPFPDC